MFPNDVDKDRYPRSTRTWGIFVGTLIMIAVPLCLVSPGTLEITTPIVFAACLFAAWMRGYFKRILVPPVTHGTKVAAALIAFAALSALWADRPMQSLNWVSGTALVAVCCGIVARYMLMEPRSSALHIAEGLWIGFLVGMLYLGIESLTDQSLKIAAYNLIGLKPANLKPPSFFTWKDGVLVAIKDFDLTRSFTAAPLLLWGVLLAILGSLRPHLGKPLAIFTFVLSAAVLFVGNNETAKVALVSGSIAFAVAAFSVKWSSRLLRGAWVVVCLAIVPISLSLYRANLHNAPWVQPTAQHRIIIWNRFTEETLKRPILGVGAGMAYWNFDPNKTVRQGESHARYSRDVHCVYLQFWFELGVFGAVLLSLLGLAIIQRLDRFPEAAVPYAHAGFASAAAVMGSSYGLWRPWLNLTFALSVVAFSIGLRALLRRQTVIIPPVEPPRGLPARPSPQPEGALVS